VSYCVACKLGEYSDQNTNECIKCPPGTWSGSLAANGVSSCVPCIPGTYNPLAGATSSTACIPCPAGTFGNSTGSDSREKCHSCPVGSVSNVIGAATESTCQVCPAGTASGSTKQKKCEACGYRTMAPAGSISCEPCPAGSYKISSSACEECSNTSFCPLASVEQFGAVSLAFLSELGTPQPPKALFKDITKNPDLELPWYMSYIFWVKVAFIVGGIGVILLLVVGVGIVMCMRPKSRQKIRVLDLFFYYAHLLKRKDPLIFRPTLLGAQLSMITICLIIIAGLFILFSFLTDNRYFTMTSSQTDSVPPLTGDYAVSVVFHSFDSINCYGNATDSGFHSDNNITYSFERVSTTGCSVTWTCKNPCELGGFNQAVSFKLTTPGALAYAIDYSIIAPWMDGKYNLTNGRLAAPSMKQVLRGPTQTVVNILATYTRHDSYSNYVFPPPLTTLQSRYGMSLQFVSNTTGSVVDASQFTEAENVVGFDIVFTLNPLTSRINELPRQTIFLVISQIASLSTLTITTFTITFPLWDIIKRKVESKVKEMKSKKDKLRFVEDISLKTIPKGLFEELNPQNKSPTTPEDTFDELTEHPSISKELRDTIRNKR
jgi:hypothetical protein